MLKLDKEVEDFMKNNLLFIEFGVGCKIIFGDRKSFFIAELLKKKANKN